MSYFLFLPVLLLTLSAYGPEVPSTTFDLIRYSRRNTFVAFDEYLDYMPNFKRILEERPDIKARLTLPDGHIYSLPRVEEMGLKQYPNLLYINEAWVKSLIRSGDIDFLTEAEVKDGLDLSREEYKEILRLFKTKDMNWNGNINATGAGDAFFASALHKLVGKDILSLNKEELTECLDFANACGALTCRVNGSLDGIESEEQVEEFKKRGLRNSKQPFVFPGSILC